MQDDKHALNQRHYDIVSQLVAIAVRMGHIRVVLAFDPLTPERRQALEAEYQQLLNRLDALSSQL